MPHAEARRDPRTVRVGAWQAPLVPPGSRDALDLLRAAVARAESLGAEYLCCPEALVGGLADDVEDPSTLAIDVASGELAALAAPLASDTVTTILGFTEMDCGRLFNSAAVVHHGRIAGVYRKRHPAINRSVYQPGDTAPVYTIGELTFGIVICRDSSFVEPARGMASRGAAALFVPTNNGLPAAKGGPELVALARRDDVARAVENGVSVVRADVAGVTTGLVSYGSSGIVDPHGHLLAEARRLETDLVVADIATAPTRRPPVLVYTQPCNPALPKESRPAHGSGPTTQGLSKDATPSRAKRVESRRES